MGVPIVEPEVSLDGSHDIEKCKEVTRKVWKMQYEVLQQYGVMMEGMLFKPAMIVPGADAPSKEPAEKVAKYTPDAPWNVSFSFARALQSSVLKTWGGKPENAKKAQDMLRGVPGERACADGQVQRRCCGSRPPIDHGLPLREGVPVLGTCHPLPRSADRPFHVKIFKFFVWMAADLAASRPRKHFRGFLKQVFLKV